MKSFRWLTLVAALIIIVCEVLIFRSEAAQELQSQATGAAVGDRESP
jgi:hypothetical protein